LRNIGTPIGSQVLTKSKRTITYRLLKELYPNQKEEEEIATTIAANSNIMACGS